MITTETKINILIIFTKRIKPRFCFFMRFFVFVFFFEQHLIMYIGHL